MRDAPASSAAGRRGTCTAACPLDDGRCLRPRSVVRVRQCALAQAPERELRQAEQDAAQASAQAIGSVHGKGQEADRRLPEPVDNVQRTGERPDEDSVLVEEQEARVRRIALVERGGEDVGLAQRHHQRRLGPRELGQAPFAKRRPDEPGGNVVGRRDGARRRCGNERKAARAVDDAPEPRTRRRRDRRRLGYVGRATANLGRLRERCIDRREQLCHAVP